MASEEARSGRQAGAYQRDAQCRAVFIPAKAVCALVNRKYQKQNIEQAKTAAAEAQKDLERRVEQLRNSMSPEELEALTRKLKQENAPAAAEESREKTEEK